ncbi:MAG: hypothetical protein AB8D78_13685 [Akkermansiaceae bacterium]
MNEIEKAIHEIQVKHGIHGRKKAWLAGCAAFVFVMVLAAILDRSMMFSGLARWSGWTLGLAVAALAAWLAKGASTPDANTLAHKIEADAGETAPVVVTSIDPAVRRLAGKEPFGDVLLKRLDQRAEDAMKAAPPSFMGSLKIPVGILAAALAAIVILLSLQGGNGLLRMMVPWYSASYTSLSLEALKQPIAEGKPFTLTAQVSGLRPEKVSLFRVGSEVVVAEGKPDERGFVNLSVAGLESSAEFVARASDGVSGSVLVETYALPEIAKFEIVVTPPAYTQLETRTEIDPSFTVIRASRLQYRLHLDAAAVSVKLERSAFAREDEMVTKDDVLITENDEFGTRVTGQEKNSGAPVLPVFRRDPSDPLVWEMDWELPKPESIVYRIVIEGPRGDLIRNDEPWRINVLPDKPPTIRILSEDSADVVETGKEEVRIELGAVDDIRLASVRLIFRKPGSPYTTVNIDLPADTARTWTGAELLALAPMDLKPLDMVAVHAETEDGNTLDGPGMARSDVVFIEVPLPEDDGAGDDGDGEGGGGSSPEPINPLELQKEILRGTLALAKDSRESDRQALVNDQRQNAEYAGMMAGAMANEGATELAEILGRAQTAMESATVLLGSADPLGAVPREETALGALIEAAQALGDAEIKPMPPSEGESEMMTFTLRPEEPKSSEPEDSEEAKEKNEEALRKLIEKVKKQLAEQEALNEKAKEEAEKEAAGEPSEKPSDKPSDKPDSPSDKPGSPSDNPSGAPSGAPSEMAAQLGALQQEIAQATRDAANIAKGMESSADSTGDPKAAAEDLADAADLQDTLAEALEGGEGDLESELGEKTSEALKGALEELNALLKTRSDEGGDRSVGYERLISDYLRSISYE